MYSSICSLYIIDSKFIFESIQSQTNWVMLLIDSIIHLEVFETIDPEVILD